jgi:hypothetical protein
MIYWFLDINSYKNYAAKIVFQPFEQNAGWPERVIFCGNILHAKKRLKLPAQP